MCSASSMGPTCRVKGILGFRRLFGIETFCAAFQHRAIRALKRMEITVNCVHPGVVRAQMMLNAPGPFKIVSWLAPPFAISAKAGAATPVYAATSPALERVTGRYFVSRKPAAIKSKFNTAPYRRRLWDISIGSLRDRGLLEHSDLSGV
jgi:hypothetical protein